MRISRRLFVVPLANDKHGKSTIVRSLVSQGTGKAIGHHKKGIRELTGPSGQKIDAYVFGRSYQEVERRNFGSVRAALDGNDPDWQTRELIIMPSHVSNEDHGDIEEMIDAAHSAGFDAIAVSVILLKSDSDNRGDFPDIWRMAWNERWTISNPCRKNFGSQLKAIGHDLWTRIRKALA